MKKAIIILGVLGLIFWGGLYVKRKVFHSEYGLNNSKADVKQLAEKNDIRNGDLIFQTSLSGQSNAIQFATKSKYSHCGLIYKEGPNFYVLEAVQPVKLTPLNSWIARGKDGHFVIKRLKNAEHVLTGEALQKMKGVSESFTGKLGVT